MEIVQLTSGGQEYAKEKIISMKSVLNKALIEPGLPIGEVVPIMQTLASSIKEEDMIKRWADIEKATTLSEIASMHDVSTYRIKALIKRDIRRALDGI